MITMNVFNDDAFSATNMTAALDKLGYIPTLLGDLRVFNPVPVNTTHVFIEERADNAALIQTTARGAPPRNTGSEKRTVRGFETHRLADQSRITAAQLQGIRAFGSTTELQSLANEIARRQARIKNNFTLTMENWRLTTVCGGITKDANGANLNDWPTLLSQSLGADVVFDFSGDGVQGVIRVTCNHVNRAVKRALQKGNASDAVRVYALAGDNFYDALTSCKEVANTYLHYAAAADLRAGQGAAWETFTYGQITFVNYRGTDDGDTDSKGTVGVDPDVCHFFPVSASPSESIFQMALAPGESLDDVNTAGKELYSLMVVDDDRYFWADVEMYSYPLAVCTLPSALMKGTISG